MGFITPEEIATKAKNAYARFLVEWVSGSSGDFFPYRVRANLKLDSSNPKAVIASIEKLLSKSKAERGWGYTVQRGEARSRTFGKNLVRNRSGLILWRTCCGLRESKKNFVSRRLLLARFARAFLNWKIGSGGTLRRCTNILMRWTA